MSKIIGFNQEVAQAAEDKKRADQRRSSLASASKRVHFVRNAEGFNLLESAKIGGKL